MKNVVNDASPLLVLLDLDNTLIYTSVYPLRAKKHDFRPGKEYTYKRPGVEKFLQELFADPRFDIMVWTTAGRDYAEVVLKGLGIDKNELKLFLTSADSIKSELLPTDYGFANFNYRLNKDLIKVRRKSKYKLSRIVAVDDNTGVFLRQYSNQVKMPFYEGNEEENPFPNLFSFLEHLHGQENVRPVEKRGWNNFDWSEKTL